MQRGQISFEVLLLTLSVITITAIISGLALATFDSTIGISIIQNELTKQINSKDSEILLERVTFFDNPPRFIVETIPNNYANDDFDIDLIKEKILRVTQFSDFDINLNISPNN
jgi:hypothetical protein